MGELLHINRQGGYPLCAETLEILNENSEMMRWLFSTIVTNNSAVILGGGYLYVRYNGRNRVVKMNITGDANRLQFENAKVVITDTTYDVTNNNNQTIEDVYRIGTATIEQTTVASEKWKIYRLSDLLEVRKMNNLLPAFEAGLSGATISTRLNELTLWNEKNVLERNDTRCRIRLNLYVDFEPEPANNTPFPIQQQINSCRLNVPVPIEGNFPLTASMELVSTGVNYSVDACVKNGEIVINLGNITGNTAVRVIVRINNDLVL